MSSPLRLLLAVLLALGSAAPAIARAQGADAGAPTRLTGQVFAAGDGAVAGLQLHIRAGEFVDSIAIEDDGRFLYVAPRVLRAPVELIVDARAGSIRRYHPAVARLGRAELAEDQRFVLVPLRWPIETGRFAGSTVEIRLDRAFAPPCRGCAGFYRRGHADAVGPVRGDVPAWPEQMFPLRVAFDRAGSDAAISARDSVQFWRIASSVNEVFGEALFRPASFVETLPVDEHGPNDVVLVWVVPSMRYAGRGAVGLHQSDIISGVVWLKSTRLISGPDGSALLTHELIHALGFGHTCSWRSVVADSRCPGQRSATLTAEDVAHVQLARRVAALARRVDARWALEAALAGERALTLGPAPDEPRADG